MRKNYFALGIALCALLVMTTASSVQAAGNATAADATGTVEYTDKNGVKKSVTITASQTARAMASKTRTRSKMPAFATGMTNDEFWAKYKKERQVELAFEGHRFYDVRRWMEDGDKFVNVHGMKIVKNDDGTFSYSTFAITRGNGQWQSKWNLFPFSQTEYETPLSLSRTLTAAGFED